MRFRQDRRRTHRSGGGSRSSLWLAVIAVALLAVPSALGEPPTTSIATAPPTLSASATATFEFAASDPTATFECNLDASGWAPCASPAGYGPLGDGGHTFAVRGTVVGEGTGAAAQHSWTIDTTPPAAPTILTGPLGTILTLLTTFTFTVPEGSAQCSLDGGSYTACSSPHLLVGLLEGAHSFVVRAVDAAGNVSPPSTPWTWGVDATPPGAPAITDGPTGIIASATATVSFVADGNGECSLDGGSFSPCSSPHQVAGLADGAHAFAVRAVDGAGNRSPESTRTWTVDTTPPPAPAITGGPTGTVATDTASLTFQAEDSAQCSLDDAAFASCTSPHQVAGLGDGTHAFSVRAVDAVGNQSAAAGPRTWVVDTTKPTLVLPEGVTVEANGPGGSVVHYNVSASDRGAPLLPSAIDCSPRSGFPFPLGRTFVTCTATDSAGNRSESAFPVTVRDTTPPAINAPDATVTAPRAAGIRRTDAALAAYLNGVRATDLVSSPAVTNDAPEQLPVGKTKVTFTARDAAGNSSTSAATVTVRPPGSPSTPVDVKPPADVPGVRVVAGDRTVTITWSKPGSDVAVVAVFRNRAGLTGNGTQIYRGIKRRVVDSRLVNGVRYRYVVVAFDRAGNRSRGVVRLASPAVQLLLAPRPNARVSTPPLLRWKAVSPASYYNVQIWRGDRKILSSWPTGTQLRVPRSWSFEGRRYRLTPGTYTWYVWPGLGAKADARYGRMLGRSTFRVAPPV